MSLRSLRLIRERTWVGRIEEYVNKDAGEAAFKVARMPASRRKEALSM